jgi:hypothetical protein
MTDDTVYYTQLVTAMLPSPIRISLRESFQLLGFSVRPYINDSGFTSSVKFYVDYDRPSLLTLWELKYGSEFPDLVMREVVYP